MTTIHAHLFRKDGVDHIVLSSFKRVRRSNASPNGHHFLCGPRLTPEAIRISAVTRGCDNCLRSFNGFVELCERAEALTTG
jgi:hypothetical protein